MTATDSKRTITPRPDPICPCQDAGRIPELTFIANLLATADPPVSGVAIPRAGLYQCPLCKTVTLGKPKEGT